MGRLVHFLIPYDTFAERKCIVNTLREYDNDENRIGHKVRFIFDCPFNTYRQKCKPRGKRVITWIIRLLPPVVEAHLELLNDRFEIIQKRAYLVTPAMEKRIAIAMGMYSLNMFIEGVDPNLEP